MMHCGKWRAPAVARPQSVFAQARSISPALPAGDLARRWNGGAQAMRSFREIYALTNNGDTKFCGLGCLPRSSRETIGNSRFAIGVWNNDGLAQATKGDPLQGRNWIDADKRQGRVQDHAVRKSVEARGHQAPLATFAGTHFLESYEYPFKRHPSEKWPESRPVGRSGESRSRCRLQIEGSLCRDRTVIRSGREPDGTSQGRRGPQNADRLLQGHRVQTRQEARRAHLRSGCGHPVYARKRVLRLKMRIEFNLLSPHLRSRRICFRQSRK